MNSVIASIYHLRQFLCGTGRVNRGRALQTLSVVARQGFLKQNLQDSITEEEDFTEKETCVHSEYLRIQQNTHQYRHLRKLPKVEGRIL